MRCEVTLCNMMLCAMLCERKRGDKDNIRSYALSWKPCQGDSLNLPDHRIHKDGDGDASFQLKSDSLPHAHAQSTKTFYKHQDSRIMKAQELKTKTSAQTLIYKIFLQRYQVYQGRLLASFQDDAKYEHVGQDTRSQGGKDDQDKQGKDLKISDIKTKSKDNDKGSRSKITKHEGTSLQRIQRPRPQDLNDKSNLINLMKECHNELTSGEIVSLKILSRTMEVWVECWFNGYVQWPVGVFKNVLRVFPVKAKVGPVSRAMWDRLGCFILCTYNIRRICSSTVIPPFPLARSLVVFLSKGISVVLSKASDKWLSKVQSTQFSGFTEYRVFGPSAVTLEVYNVAGRPVMKSVVEGVNGAVLCLRMALQAMKRRINTHE
ncbi:hypothetical protein Tco_1285339 [Tanacetum coccineum]